MTLRTIQSRHASATDGRIVTRAVTAEEESVIIQCGQMKDASDVTVISECQHGLEGAHRNESSDDEMSEDNDGVEEHSDIEDYLVRSAQPEAKFNEDEVRENCTIVVSNPSPLNNVSSSSPSIVVSSSTSFVAVSCFSSSYVVPEVVPELIEPSILQPVSTGFHLATYASAAFNSYASSDLRFISVSSVSQSTSTKCITSSITPIVTPSALPTLPHPTIWINSEPNISNSNIEMTLVLGVPSVLTSPVGSPCVKVLSTVISPIPLLGETSGTVYLSPPCIIPPVNSISYVQQCSNIAVIAVIPSGNLPPGIIAIIPASPPLIAAPSTHIITGLLPMVTVTPPQMAASLALLEVAGLPPLLTAVQAPSIVQTFNLPLTVLTTSNVDPDIDLYQDSSETDPPIETCSSGRDDISSQAHNSVDVQTHFNDTPPVPLNLASPGSNVDSELIEEITTSTVAVGDIVLCIVHVAFHRMLPVCSFSVVVHRYRLAYTSVHVCRMLHANASRLISNASNCLSFILHYGFLFF